MIERPKLIIIVMLLWLSLSAIFLSWGVYSITVMIQIPNWVDIEEISSIVPVLHFVYLISTIVWFVFSSLFIVFAYGTFRKDSWVWTTGVIISTIFLAVFGLMLASFMINAIMFKDDFSITGLTTVILSFITDLGIVFFLTRPNTKAYFELK